MPGASPFLTRLGTGLFTLNGPSGNKTLVVDGGFAQMQGDALTLLADSAVAAESIDGKQATDELAQANAKAVNGAGTTEAARDAAERAQALAGEHAMLASSAALVAALGELRHHSANAVEPRKQRPERDAALVRLQHVAEQPDTAAPEAVYLRSLLAYEAGDMGAAARGFERAIAGLRRIEGRDVPLRDRARFFQAAALLAGEIGRAHV